MLTNLSLTVLIVMLLTALGGYLINKLPPIPDFRGRKFLTLCLTFEVTVLSLIVTAWKEFFSRNSSYQVAAMTVGVIVLLLFIWHIFQLGWRIYQAWKKGNLTNQNQIKVLKTPKDWRRELLKAMKGDVEARLHESLHKQGIIRVETQIQPQQVGVTPLVTNNGRSYLESGKPIIEFFDGLDIPGWLLILGEHGAGKTTLLLELARDLIERAQQNPDDPIPVLFELTNWSEKKQGFVEWLVADLKFRYNIPEKISSRWFDAELNQKKSELLPLFDGLDELSLTRQKKCINTINNVVQKYSNLLPLVVCSRQEEYEQSQAIVSNLRSTVYLQALSERQIQAYLQRLGFIDLWENIQKDPDGLGQLAKIPLFLTLIPLAYSDGLHNQVRDYQVSRLNSEKERKEYQDKIRKDLFDAYIENKLREEHDNKGYKPEDTKRWLIWLAKKMEKHNLQEFYIEKMGPGYLNIFEKIQYSLIIGLISGLISGLIIGLGYERGSNMMIPLIYGLFYGLIFGILSLFTPSINTTETLKIGFDFKAWLIFVLISGLIIMLIPGLISGLIPGLIIVLIIVLNRGAKLNYRNNPNQGIQESAKNIIVLTFIVLPIVISFLTAAGVHIHGQNLNLTSIVIRESLGVLIFGIALTGITVIQHIFLRFILWTNRSIPWNYGHFLTYASDRKLVNKVGGRFTFIHAFLQEHFAQMG